MDKLAGCLIFAVIAIIVLIFVAGFLFAKFGAITFLYIFAAIGLIVVLGSIFG